MESTDYDVLFKLVLIGDSAVGKSALLLRFAEDSFGEAYVSTVGVDFRWRHVKRGTQSIKLSIWDTAGQERFRSITSSYFSGADGIILVYDVTNQESFEHVQHWLDEVHKNADEDSVLLLVGNKNDLPAREVPFATGKAYADSIGVSFLETSAKSGSNVEEAFLTITDELCKSTRGRRRETTTSLRERPRDKKKKCCS